MVMHYITLQYSTVLSPPVQSTGSVTVTAGEARLAVAAPVHGVAAEMITLLTSDHQKYILFYSVRIKEIKSPYHKMLKKNSQNNFYL